MEVYQVVRRYRRPGETFPFGETVEATCIDGQEAQYIASCLDRETNHASMTDFLRFVEAQDILGVRLNHIVRKVEVAVPVDSREGVMA